MEDNNKEIVEIIETEDNNVIIIKNDIENIEYDSNFWE